MAIELNGLPLLRARIDEPLVGIWTADVEADTDTAITGAATITIEDVAWVGTVFRGGVESGRWQGRIVGGAGGMSTRLPAKFYRVATARTALDDIMTATGETLDTDASDATALAYTLQRWQRRAGTAYAALDLLATEAGTSVRVQRDGTWLVATSAYPVLEVDHDQVDARPAAGVRTIAPAGSPSAAPGVTLDGERVDYVVTTVSPGALRQELWSARA